MEAARAALRQIDTEPDTVGMAEACTRLGITVDLGWRLARQGHELCPGVSILRFGAPGSHRPVYRVSRAQIDAVLAVPQPKDDPATSRPRRRPAWARR